MTDTMTITLPALAWYGDCGVDIDLPSSWSVSVLRHRGDGAPELDDAGLRRAFASPIGCAPIREGARGKREVCILFDDMSRATPSADIIPYILEELATAGVTDDRIRFIAAIGAHGSMNGIDFAKKLGRDVMGRFPVYNHNPYENCVRVGVSPQGIPTEFNAEVMRCDYKIGIGTIVPHRTVGFGGGGKIILPGVSSMTTIYENHSRLGPRAVSDIGKSDGLPMKRDIDDAARMAGLDVKVDCIYNLNRRVTHLFVGDHMAEHAAGVAVARDYWATEKVEDCDIVIANCFSKANESLVGIGKSAPLLKKSGGELALLVITPEGQINHYLARSFGRTAGGRMYRPKVGLPSGVGRLTVVQPYPDFVGADWFAPYELVNFTRSWPETLEQLTARWGAHAKVALVPDITVQYFPGTVTSM